MKKCCLLLLAFCLPFIAYSQKKEVTAAQKLVMAEYLIHKLYVDSLNEDKLVEEGIRGMLRSLDPHSTYSSVEDVKAFNEQINGQFVGVGIRFQLLRDTVYVVELISGGPAAKAGLEVGDRILSVDTTSVAGVGVEVAKLRDLLRGPKKTKVRLQVFRASTQEILRFTLSRKEVNVSAVEGSYFITPRTAYIRFAQFSKESSKEFKQALSKLIKQGATRLILDLRGNGGGLLSEAIEVANHFLKAKQRIVYTLGKADKNRSFYARGDGLFKTGALVVLIDEHSASASEIVAGAIQDWDRGILVGRKSFGKGLVQKPLSLSDGSLIRLTTARYYTPAGRCIQKPYASGEKARNIYREEISTRMEHGELIQDTIQNVDSLAYKTLLKFRPIYGGGGIMPDVFVPIQGSISSNPLYREIINQGFLFELVAKYIEQHKTNIQQSLSVQQFAERGGFDEELVETLFTRLKETGIAVSQSDKLSLSDFLLFQLKALVAQQIWGQEAYYQLLNLTDPTVLKALEVLENSAVTE